MSTRSSSPRTSTQKPAYLPNLVFLAVRDLHQSLADRLQALDRQFDSHLVNSSGSMSSKSLRGAILLKLNFHTLTNMLFLGCKVNAVIHERATETFKHIISITRALFRGSDGEGRPQHTLQSNLDAGIVGSLHHAAMCVGTFEVCRAAVGLLRTHALQEGLANQQLERDGAEYRSHRCNWCSIVRLQTLHIISMRFQTTAIRIL